MTTTAKISRKDHILQSLARMLETSPGERITTAALAQQVGVSEAALYRHFPSKARIFEGLIKFIEETLFMRIGRILTEEASAAKRCENILFLVLSFADKNPGITRILTGDALTGETERLRARTAQIFDRLESQLKQILREAQIRENLKSPILPAALANLLMVYCQGQLIQFVRSEFKRSPLENWQAHWEFLERHLLDPAQLIGSSQSHQTDNPQAMP
jgi:TetR/AcrR family transcriptional regulator